MEGVIKYKVNWGKDSLISQSDYKKIEPFRRIAFNNKYIGQGNDGIGYGNISCRLGDLNEFVISGSNTGFKSNLGVDDYSKVIDFSISDNYLSCIGGTIASSESLSHAAIYSANKKVNAILHFHNSTIWKQYINILPTTSIEAEYGTPMMALSIMEIVSNKENDEGIIIMHGHTNGVIAYAGDLERLFDIVLNY